MKGLVAVAAAVLLATVGFVREQRGEKSCTSQPRNDQQSDQSKTGRLGRALKAVVIRSARQARSKPLSRVKQGDYLAISDEKDGWFGILMADRTTGWIPKSDIATLDYEVVQAKTGDVGSVDPQTGPQKKIVQKASELLGSPYRRGGYSAKGWDSGAFVQRCYEAAGIRLPRAPREQISRGASVKPADLHAADRVYFSNERGYVVHTGIYLGNGYFIHASPQHRSVVVSRLSDAEYARSYAGARR